MMGWRGLDQDREIRRGIQDENEIFGSIKRG